MSKIDQVTGRLKTRNAGSSIWHSLIMLFVLVAMFIVLSILSPAFSKPGNLINILKQTAINGILASVVSVPLYWALRPALIRGNFLPKD